MARLDRLGPTVKDIAQVGAVIGREFAYELLAAVAQQGETELQGALDQLVAAGLALRRGTPPEATFLFKHALVQDAAYSTLLRGRRQELHAGVAAALEERLPEMVEGQPEILAHHCAQAGLLERAVGYYAQAGQQAVARSAMAEAIAQLEKGLDLLTSLPDAAPRQRQELDLQVALGQALIAARGYAAPAVGETYARAGALCERLGRLSQQILPVLYGQYVHHLIAGSLRLAQRFAAEILQLGEAGSDAVATIGHRHCGHTSFVLGDLVAARAHLEQALARFDPAHRRFHASFVVQDGWVMALVYLSRGLLCLGHLDEARLRSDEAVKEAHDLGHAYSLAGALKNACWMDWALRSRADVLARAEAAIATSAEKGFPFYLAMGTIFRGWALAGEGERGAEGIKLLQDGLAAFRATAAVQFVPFFLMPLADAQGRAGSRTGGSSTRRGPAPAGRDLGAFGRGRVASGPGQVAGRRAASRRGRALRRQAIGVARRQGASSRSGAPSSASPGSGASRGGPGEACIPRASMAVLPKGSIRPISSKRRRRSTNWASRKSRPRPATAAALMRS